MGFFNDEDARGADGAYRNDYRGLLSYAVSRLEQQGISGIGSWVSKGDKFVEDRIVLTFRNVSMKSDVFDLALLMNAKGVSVDPATWASWMCNVEMTHLPNSVRLAFMSKFRLDYARQKLGDALGRYFAGKNLDFVVDPSLNNEILK